MRRFPVQDDDVLVADNKGPIGFYSSYVYWCRGQILSAAQGDTPCTMASTQGGIPQDHCHYLGFLGNSKSYQEWASACIDICSIIMYSVIVN